MHGVYTGTIPITDACNVVVVVVHESERKRRYGSTICKIHSKYEVFEERAFRIIDSAGREGELY